MESQIEDKLAYKIIDCALKVHNTIGNGLQEVIYQRCLAIELGKNNIEFVREQELPIFYENIQVGTRRTHFIVVGEVMVELKSILKLEEVHFAEALKDLTSYQIERGLLINFGTTSLEVERLFRKN
jgi:GxxExxY protein